MMSLELMDFACFYRLSKVENFKNPLIIQTQILVLRYSINKQYFDVFKNDNL